MKKIFSLLLVLMLLVAFVACSGTEKETAGAPETQGTQTTAPETTAPETTAPETTAPETTAPETTEPETTAPETTVPETTEPETTAPETTAPETTAPETTEPETTEPETTEPETTEPETDNGGAEEYEPDDGDVLFFKPVLDGLLDAEYLKSACLVGGRTVYGQDAPPTSEDFTYFLWDGEYFYACAVVYDDDIVTRGDKYVNEALNENPFCNDAIELWYTFDGDAPTNKSMVYKACLDAFGKKLFSSLSEGFLSENFQGIEYAATQHIDETDPANSYYICEFKFPCKDEFGTLLDVDSSVYFSSQIDDVKYGLDDVVIDEKGLMGNPGAAITLGYADDYAAGVGHNATTKENNLVGFTWTDSRENFPKIETGDMGGYVELILLGVEPKDVADEYADEFPTRLYELNIAQ